MRPQEGRREGKEWLTHGFYTPVVSKRELSPEAVSTWKVGKYPASSIGCLPPRARSGHRSALQIDPRVEQSPGIAVT